MKKLMLLLMFTAAIFAEWNLSAQVSGPQIGYVYPAGGRAGETLDVVVGGMALRNVNSAYVSGGSVTIVSAKLFNPFKNFSNDLKNELRPIIVAIEKGDDPVAASVKSTERQLERLKRQAEKDAEDGKPPGSDNMLKIVPGERLIHLDMTPEEVVEYIKGMPPIEYQCLCKEILTRPNPLQASPAIAQKALLRLKIEPDAKPGIRELRVIGDAGVSNPLRFVVGSVPEKTEEYFIPELKRKTPFIEAFPALMNGEIMPGEVDSVKFEAGRGEAFLFTLKGRALVPFLGDAVPGWFQPVISVHGEDGAMLVSADDNYGDPDPVLRFTAPSDGKYEMRIRDSIYRGREDFVYRLKAEKISGPDSPAIPFAPPGRFSHLERFGEVDGNDSVAAAQSIGFPSMVSGTFSKSGDADYYRAKFAEGDKVVVETFSRRGGSPADTLVQIFSPRGGLVASNDDFRNPNVGLATHHADSICVLDAEREGEHVIRVSEAQRKGGGEYRYILRVDRPRPDFAAYIYPSAINLRSGTSAPFKIRLERHDGFNGEIEISLKDAPKGVSISGGKIPSGVSEVNATIFVPADLKPGLHPIRLAASANFADSKVESDVVPCDEMMQAFIYYHLVPASEALVSVVRKGWMPAVEMPEKIELQPGGTVELSLKSSALRSEKSRFCVELFSPPKGVEVMDSRVEGGSCVVSLKCAENSKPWRGNLVFVCYPVSKDGGKNAKVKWQMGALPAVPAEIKP